MAESLARSVRAEAVAEAAERRADRIAGEAATSLAYSKRHEEEVVKALEAARGAESRAARAAEQQMVEAVARAERAEAAAADAEERLARAGRREEQRAASEAVKASDAEAGDAEGRGRDAGGCRMRSRSQPVLRLCGGNPYSNPSRRTSIFKLTGDPAEIQCVAYTRQGQLCKHRVGGDKVVCPTHMEQFAQKLLEQASEEARQAAAAAAVASTRGAARADHFPPQPAGVPSPPCAPHRPSAPPSPPPRAPAAAAARPAPSSPAAAALLLVASGTHAPAQACAAGGPQRVAVGGLMAALKEGGRAGDLQALEPIFCERRPMGRLTLKAIRAAGAAFCAKMGTAVALGEAAGVWGVAREALLAMDRELPKVARRGRKRPPRSVKARVTALARAGEVSRAAAALTSEFVEGQRALDVAKSDLRADLPSGPPVRLATPAPGVVTDDVLAAVMGEVRKAVASAKLRRGAGPSGVYPDGLHAVLADCPEATRFVAQLVILGERFGPPAWLAAGQAAVIKSGSKERLIASPEALAKLIERCLVGRLRGALAAMDYAAAPFLPDGAAALGALTQVRVGMGEYVMVADGVSAYNHIHHRALVEGAPPTYSVWLGGCLAMRSLVLEGKVLAVPELRGAGLGGPVMVAAFSVAMNQVAQRVAPNYASCAIRFYLDDLIVSGPDSILVQACYDAVELELAAVGVTLGKLQSNVGRGAQLSSVLGVPMGDGETKRFLKANRLLDCLPDLELDVAFKLLPTVGAIVAYDVAIANPSAIVGARELDAKVESQFVPRLRTTPAALRRPVRALGLGVPAVEDSAAAALRRLGLRILSGVEGATLWLALGKVAAGESGSAFARQLHKALSEDEWSIDTVAKVTRFQGEPCALFAEAKEVMEAEQTVPLPFGHPTGVSLAGAVRTGGPCPKLSPAGMRAVTNALSGVYFETPEQIAARGPCELCGEQGGGLAHGRVCGKIPAEARWGAHHAAVKALVGFAARTRNSSAEAEVWISDSVRADAVLTSPGGVKEIIEVKTYVKASKSYRNQTAKAVIRTKEILARKQYEGEASCLGIVRPLVFDTCSMRISDEGAEVLRRLQCDRDNVGTDIPAQEEEIAAVVGVAVAEALGRVDNAYEAMVKAARARARGTSAAAVTGAAGVSDGGAVAQQDGSDGAGGHIHPTPRAAAGQANTLSPSPPQSRNSGGLAGESPGVGDRQVRQASSSAFGTPPLAPALRSATHPQTNVSGGRTGGGPRATAYSRNHPQNKHSGDVTGRPRILRR